MSEDSHIEKAPLVPPFVRYVASAIPMVFDDSLSYYECLAALTKYLQDNIADVINNNATVTEEYIQMTKDMQSYMDNYFENLDVQEEINNKLDEMVTTGQLQSLIDYYFSGITAKIDAQDAVIEEFKEEVNSTIDDQNERIDDAIDEQNTSIQALDSRMDTFTHLTDGSTTGDAELADIRVGYNGATYDSAGTAVRTQVADIYLDEKNTLADYIEADYKFNLINSNTPTKENLAASTSGTVTAINGVTTYQFPVKPGKTLVSTVAAQNFIFFSNYEDMTNWANGQTLHNFLSYVTTSAGSRVVTVPSGAKFCCVPFSTNASRVAIFYGNAPSEKLASITKKGIKTSDILDLSYFDKYLKKSIGNNLFNKNSTNRVANSWVQYQNGKLAHLDNYYAYVIPLDSNQTTISCNDSGKQNFAFYSEVVDLDEYKHPAEGEGSVQLDHYISGAVGKTNIAIPEGAKCVIVSPSTPKLDTYMINYGATALTYENYVEGILKEDIIGLTQSEVKNIYTVDQSGSGDYTTITEAVLDVPNYSVIIINPGTYNESVDVRSTNKTLYIIGINRDECIITQPVTDYTTPPMEIGSGLVENITFNTTGYETVSGQLTAYCVHIDYDQEANHGLQFKNCNFFNTIRECVGIGTRENCHISFVGCQFKSERRCAFIHEQQADNKKNQNVEFIDCSMQGGSELSVIKMQETSTYIGNECNIKFQRCIVKNTSNYTPYVEMVDLVTHEAPSGNKWLNSNIWTLDFMSDMNNIDVLNA